MLILEGPDMVGKTTIAKAIADAVPTAKYDKFGLPEADYQGLAPWLRRAGPNVICDRYWISEFIYGLVCRGKSNITPEMHFTMLQAMREIGANIQLICSHPLAYSLLLNKRYDPAREAFSAKQCEAVNEAYWELSNGRSWEGYTMIVPMNVVAAKPDGAISHMSPSWVRAVVDSWTAGIDGRAAWFEYGGMAECVQPLLDQYGETL